MTPDKVHVLLRALEGGSVVIGLISTTIMPIFVVEWISKMKARRNR